MEDDVKLCPYCDNEMEEIVQTGPFGRPIWGGSVVAVKLHPIMIIM